MKRRQFLKLNLAAILPTFSTSSLFAQQHTPRHLLDTPINSGQLSSLQPTASIGKKYLAQRNYKYSAIKMALDITNIRSTIQRDAFLKNIQIRAKRDFDTGDTALVDGWILSQTEANLCAAIYLMDFHK